MRLVVLGPSEQAAFPKAVAPRTNTGELSSGAEWKMVYEYRWKIPRSYRAAFPQAAALRTNTGELSSGAERKTVYK